MAKKSFEVPVNSIQSALKTAHLVWINFVECKYFRLKFIFTRSRSLDQNALWFAFYKRISESIGLGTAQDALEWRAYCKLKFGVPILQHDSEEFRILWQRLVLSNPNYQTWREQLDLMIDRVVFPATQGFPVTSLLDRSQGVEYTNEILAHFCSMGVNFEDLLSEGREDA